MIRSILCTLVLMALALTGGGQNYIGMSKDAILEAMRREHPLFGSAKEVNTQRKHYLKFENAHQEETLLFILDDHERCIAVSRMYNVWLLQQVRSELDRRYTAKGHSVWEEQRDGQRYQITLRRGDWFITVTTRRSDHQAH